jgi:hypothetical protein
MATTIGSVTCDYIASAKATRTKKEHVEVWSVPGLAGAGMAVMGKSKAWSAFRLVLFGTSAEVETWIAAIEALSGTVVTVVDDWGTEFSNFGVVFVSEPDKRAAHQPGQTTEAVCVLTVEGQIVA